MSYILDALRKAERERTLGQAPTLDTHYAVVSTPRQGVPRWLLVAGAGLAVVLAAALFFGLRSPPETEIAEDAEPIPDVAVVTDVEPAPASLAPPPPPPPSVETVTVQTAEGPLQAEIPIAPAEPPLPASADEPVEPTALVAPPESAAPAAEPGPPLQELPAGEPPEEAIGPDTPEAPASDDPDAIVPRSRAKLDIPSYEGLPESVRGGMAALSMNAHVFSSTPGRGFVMMNGRKYREGDVLSEGPEVVEILPEGVVLRFRGTDFLFPVPR